MGCSNCAAIIPVHEMKYESELEDYADVESANKPASFEVGMRIRRFSRNMINDLTQGIPKLGNKEDTELKEMVNNGAIILRIEYEYITEDNTTIINR